MGRAFNSNGQPIATTGTANRIGRADFEAYRQSRAIEQQQKSQQQQKAKLLDVSKLSNQDAYNQLIAARKAGYISKDEHLAKIQEISKREQAKIKSDFQKSVTPMAIAKSTAGTIGNTVVGAGGALIGAMASGVKRLGEGYGEVIGELTGVSGRARQAQLQSQQTVNTTIKKLNDILKNPKTSAEQKTRARLAIQDIARTSVTTSSEFAKRQAEIAERTDPLKGLAAVGEVGLDVLTAGTLPALRTALKLPKALSTAQKVAKVARPVAGGTGIGGVYGGLSTVEQKGREATGKDIATGVGVGALTGGALVGAGAALSKVAQKAKAGKTVAKAKGVVEEVSPTTKLEQAIETAKPVSTKKTIPVKQIETPQPKAVAPQVTKTKGAVRPKDVPSYVPDDKVDAYLKSDDYLKDQRFNKMASETKSGDPFDHPDMYENPTPEMQNNLKAPQPTKAPTITGEQKVTGRALRTEQQAGQEITDKATYAVASYKENKISAPELAKSDNETAWGIVEGRHEVGGAQTQAMVDALEEKAIREKDFGAMERLARSNANTELSESAQRLGQAGYDANPDSYLSRVKDVQKSLEERASKTATQSKPKVVREIKNEIKSFSAKEAKSWGKFLKGIECNG